MNAPNAHILTPIDQRRPPTVAVMPACPGVQKPAERSMGFPWAETFRPSSLPDNDQKIDQSIAYMASHLHEPLSVAKLASVANISCSHFFVVFKRRTGQAPIDYFIHLRMRRARRLLAETSMSVKDIASTLGYEDPFYFSRVFKSVASVPPTEYRAKNAATRSPAEAA